MEPVEVVDSKVRQYVFKETLTGGLPPTAAMVARALNNGESDVRASFGRLAAQRILVLQPESGEIMMANPFSAVPTPFLVETDRFRAYGNCIWDAMGIPAMLKQDGRVVTACPCCGESMTVQISGDTATGEDGVLHFSVPARHWWDNIVFT